MEWRVDKDEREAVECPLYLVLIHHALDSFVIRHSNKRCPKKVTLKHRASMFLDLSLEKQMSHLHRGEKQPSRRKLRRNTEMLSVPDTPTWNTWNGTGIRAR